MNFMPQYPNVLQQATLHPVLRRYTRLTNSIIIQCHCAEMNDHDR